MIQGLKYAMDLKEKDFDEFVKANPVVLIDFWAPWCGPCMKVAPLLEGIAKEYAGKVAVAKVDVDGMPRLAGRFNVMSIPCMVIFKNGGEVDRIIGAVQKDRITSAIGRYL
jgi:thioredoxin 1